MFGIDPGILRDLRDLRQIIASLAADPVDTLTRAEEQHEVFEPVGEYPDLPSVAAVEPTPDGSGGHSEQVLAAAAVIAAHRGLPIALDGWQICRCKCSAILPTAAMHSVHVAEQIFGGHPEKK